MAKKKKAAKPAEAEAPEEKAGEEVEVEPAHVPETVIKVRGTAVGGTKLMTASEHAEYCEAEKKKAKK